MLSFKSIYEAYISCRKNKRKNFDTLEFEQDLIYNLLNLENELKKRKYEIGKSICFLAHSPKKREIFSALFRDRIVHHLLVKPMEEFYEPKFIYDVYNNRKDKGIHKAI